MSVRPVGRWTRRTFQANLVCQIGIVVTGGAVRLTGSGLGCPTWPQCAPGSYTPTVEQAEGFHKYVEFGNRLLTFVLAVVAIAALAAAWRHRPRRRPLVLLAAAGLLGIVAQAILGGITVITGLNPAIVAAHFLLSMALIAAAALLLHRSAESSDGPATSLVRPEIRWLARALIVVSIAVLVVGTVVTGSGPHSGDADTPARFDLDPQTVSWLHADLVIAFLGLSAAMIVALRLVDGPALARSRSWQLLAVSLAQGLIGYAQYFTGLPEILVGLHMLGACLVWLFTLRLVFALSTRGGGAGDEPVSDPAAAVAA